MAEPRPLRRLPLTVQTVHADLLARLQEDAFLELGGTPVLRDRGDRQYWYAVQRLADHTIERYLGPDGNDVRGRVERVRKIKEELKQREKERGRLARMCREGGLPHVDAGTGKVLFALSKAGLFRLRAVLVGTHAFRCYPGLLGVDIPEARAATEDIDVAAFHSISVALDDRLDPALPEVLRQIGPFVAQPSLHRPPTAWREFESGEAGTWGEDAPGQGPAGGRGRSALRGRGGSWGEGSWGEGGWGGGTAWRDRRSGVKVELLAPNEGPDRDAPVELPALGAFAQPLRFLDYLIHRPTQAAALYRSGILVNVPQPARYAIHKLIVATRRTPSAAVKAGKDIEQAAALVRVLAEDRPDELEEALVEAHNRGAAWRETLEKGARRLPADARHSLAKVMETGA